MSDFDLSTAMSQLPMLHMIPYSSTYNLYRFPPSTPGLASLLGSLFTSSVTPPSEEIDVKTADAEQLKRAGEGWVTVTRTKEEVSIMLDAEMSVRVELDDLVKAQGSGGVQDGPFGCLRIRGPMELSAFLEDPAVDDLRLDFCAWIA